MVVLVALASGALAQVAAGGLSREAMLTGSPGFGTSLALSADGSTLLVVSVENFSRQGYRPGVGFVAVYVRSAGAWQFQARLAVGKATGEMALSSDGDRALVAEKTGAHSFTELFTRSGTTWRSTRRFSFHRWSGISPDLRTRAVIVQYGEVDLYGDTGDGWVSEGRVTGDAGTGFGEGIALSEHGGILMVGDAGAGGAPGAVYVYRRSGSLWRLRAILHQPNSTSRGNGFGISVGISWSGKTAVVLGPQAGHAYMFRQAAGRWLLSAVLGSKVSGVALSGDGQRAITTGYLSNSPMADLWGSASGRWVRQAHLVGPSTGRTSVVETEAALSFDGSTVALGGPQLPPNLGSNHPAPPQTPGSVDVFANG
jgi:hypothetical protein